MKHLMKMVYEKYPISKGEMKCAIEKRIMNRLRDAYLKKCLDEQKRAKEDWRGGTADKPQDGGKALPPDTKGGNMEG